MELLCRIREIKGTQSKKKKRRRRRRRRRRGGGGGGGGERTFKGKKLFRLFKFLHCARYGHIEIFIPYAVLNTKRNVCTGTDYAVKRVRCFLQYFSIRKTLYSHVGECYDYGPMVCDAV
jgi:hypothetical protein